MLRAATQRALGLKETGRFDMPLPAGFQDELFERAKARMESAGLSKLYKASAI